MPTIKIDATLKRNLDVLANREAKTDTYGKKPSYNYLLKNIFGYYGVMSTYKKQGSGAYAYKKGERTFW